MLEETKIGLVQDPSLDEALDDWTQCLKSRFLRVEGSWE